MPDGTKPVSMLPRHRIASPSLPPVRVSHKHRVVSAPAGLVGTGLVQVLSPPCGRWCNPMSKLPRTGRPRLGSLTYNAGHEAYSGRMAPCSPKSVTPSDSSHQPAPDQHPIQVDENTRRLWGWCGAQKCARTIIGGVFWGRGCRTLPSTGLISSSPCSPNLVTTTGSNQDPTSLGHYVENIQKRWVFGSRLLPVFYKAATCVKDFQNNVEVAAVPAAPNWSQRSDCKPQPVSGN